MLGNALDDPIVIPTIVIWILAIGFHFWAKHEPAYTHQGMFITALVLIVNLTMLGILWYWVITHSISSS